MATIVPYVGKHLIHNRDLGVKMSKRKGAIFRCRCGRSYTRGQLVRKRDKAKADNKNLVRCGHHYMVEETKEVRCGAVLPWSLLEEVSLDALAVQAKGATNT